MSRHKPQTLGNIVSKIPLTFDPRLTGSSKTVDDALHLESVLSEVFGQDVTDGEINSLLVNVVGKNDETSVESWDVFVDDLLKFAQSGLSSSLSAWDIPVGLSRVSKAAITRVKRYSRCQS